LTESQSAGDFSGANILVIDDKDDTREAIVAYLEYEGFHVEKALNGTQALEILKGPPPDLVLLDGSMPDIDGLDVLRTIRETPRLAHLPVIMVTARGEASDVVQGFHIGANDYLIKPVQLEVLVKRVETQLRVHELERLTATLSERLAEIKELVEQSFPLDPEDGANKDDPGDQTARELRGIVAEMIAIFAIPRSV
jgi:DNA-binding response OmpR family regulator